MALLLKKFVGLDTVEKRSGWANEIPKIILTLFLKRVPGLTVSCQKHANLGAHLTAAKKEQTTQEHERRQNM
jgi:hypothetical protein